MPRANWTTSITKAAKLARRRPLMRLAVSRPAVLGAVVLVGTLMTLLFIPVSGPLRLSRRRRTRCVGVHGCHGGHPLRGASTMAVLTLDEPRSGEHRPPGQR